jgi:hypothetical protein
MMRQICRTGVFVTALRLNEWGCVRGNCMELLNPIIFRRDETDILRETWALLKRQTPGNRDRQGLVVE